MRLLQGGDGSGNFGHKGRSGQVGGSLPYDTTDLEITSEEIGELSQSVQPSNAENEALSDYQGDGYKAINTYLRGTARYGVSEAYLEENIQNLDSYILKFEPLPRDIVVYRATEEFPPMPVGTEFTDKAFVSTSASENFLLMNRYSVMQKRFKILIPKGTHVAVMLEDALVPEEEEIILPRNSKFRVLKNEDGVHVDLELIP